MKLFISIPVPFEKLPALNDAAKKLKAQALSKKMEVQWVRPENWAINLVVLEVTEDQVPAVQNHIDEICKKWPPFKLEIRSFSAFPDLLHTRVVVCDIQNKRELATAQDQLRTAFESLGLDTGHKDERPFLTLARLRKARNFKDVFSPFANKKFGKIKVTQLILLSSEQVGPYPKYAQISQHPFPGTEDDEPLTPNDSD